jgi:hypothetical protein
MVTVHSHGRHSPWIRLADWFQGPLGVPVLNAEQTQLARVLARLFGYHIVQVGAVCNADLLDGSRISHRVVLDVDPDASTARAGHPVCTAVALPICSSSVDVVVLPHTLELEPEGRALLEEAERILIGEGHIVILGFNPWSLWGIGRLLLSWRGGMPWCGRFRPRGRVVGWLRPLGFEVVESRCFFFGPPSARRDLGRWNSLVERLGGVCWPACGGLYVLVAKKRIFGVTPIQPVWASRPRVVPNGAVGSGARRL